MNTSEQNSSPAECNLLAHWLGRLVLYLSGWRVVGQLPREAKMIILAAPHTSSWDLLYLLAAAYQLKASIKWLGKHTLFFPGLGYFLRFLGGIAVDRSQKDQMVNKLSADIAEMEKITLLVAPAGTRSKTDHWKSGFYRIALDANITLVCGYLDYKKKEAGLGPSFLPSGNMKNDMDKIRDFYCNITAKYPEKTSEIRLREE